MAIENTCNSKAGPLVSIIVITCNSAKYVLETLESAKRQSYRNIELIASDDGSADDTVDICRKWLTVNGSRFVRTEILTAPRNTGISANCNRGVRAARGEWIKLIAGDDALVDAGIQKNIDFIKIFPQVRAVHSIPETYAETFEPGNIIKSEAKPGLFNLKYIAAEEQYSLLLRHKTLISAPTVFLKSDLIAETGYFDETVPLVEDWPMWLKITKHGDKIHYLNEVTILYRRHSNSVCSNTRQEFIYDDFSDKLQPVYDKYINDNISLFERVINGIEYLRIRIIRRYFNENNIFNRILALATRKATYEIYMFYNKLFVSNKILQRKRI